MPLHKRQSFQHLLDVETSENIPNYDTLLNTSIEKNDDCPHKGNPFLRKPLWAIKDLPSEATLERHLTLFDLISIGIGSTVGSGVFVLCGLVARDDAGPSTFVCWIISGICASFSGLCYAELSGKFAVAGSSYSYVYVSMGELPAVIAGACLTLEYVFTASAVARSWGDKVSIYVQQLADHYNSTGHPNSKWNTILQILDPGYNINPAAFVVSTISVLMLLNGVKESQRVTNFFAVFKVSLVLFMCIMSIYLMQPENFEPFIPPQFGFKGVMRGSVSLFFGYIGYDEICCMAGEAINPKENLPKAVMGTIGIVTGMYVLAAIGLVGMLPFEQISAESGFPHAFHTRGVEWASQISALGEIITLPVVVLITIMAQPRLQFAMALDGLLPPIFAKIDDHGNLFFGTLISGIIMIVISALIPFTYLNDLISAGILVAFSLTDCSVLILRHESPEPMLLEKNLLLFNLLSFTLGLLIQFESSGFWYSVNAIGLITIALNISSSCPEVKSNSSDLYFETPFCPYLPLIGMFLNWYLISQLEMQSLFLLLLYMGMSVLFYFSFGAKHSIGNKGGWTREESNADEAQIPLKGHYSRSSSSSDDFYSEDGISLASDDIINDHDGISIDSCNVEF